MTSCIFMPSVPASVRSRASSSLFRSIDTPTDSCFVCFLRTFFGFRGFSDQSYCEWHLAH